MHSQDWFYIAAWPAHLHFKVKARGAIDCSAEQVKYDLQSPLTHWFLVSLLSASWMSLNCERPAKWTKILISFPPLLFSKAPYLPRTELISGKGHRKKKGRKKGVFVYFLKSIWTWLKVKPFVFSSRKVICLCETFELRLFSFIFCYCLVDDELLGWFPRWLDL